MHNEQYFEMQKNANGVFETSVNKLMICSC